MEISCPCGHVFQVETDAGQAVCEKCGRPAVAASPRRDPVRRLFPKPPPAPVAGAVRGLANRPRFGWRGSHLYLLQGGSLPATHCLICGTPQGLVLKTKKFSWINPLLYLSLCAGLWIGVVVCLLLRRTWSVATPLCLPCAKRWFLADIAYVLYIVLGLFAFPIAGALIGAQVAEGYGLISGLVAGFLSWLIGLAVLNSTLLARTQLRSAKMDDAGITLILPDPALVRRAWEAGAPGTGAGGFASPSPGAPPSRRRPR